MANSAVYFQSHPATALAGEVTFPGDKSISHRALLLASIAEGTSTVSNMLMGADNMATLAALRQLGITIEVDHQQFVTIHGKGRNGLTAPTASLDLGNSGTGLRLMAGLLAGQTFSSELNGDASLRQRPMQRIVTPLASMGARIETSASGTPPLQIHGNQSLQGIEYQMPIASAQVKSCLLLAGLYAKGRTTVNEPALSRDHTERMLRQFQYPLDIQQHHISIEGGKHLSPAHIKVPGDISSAAFFMVASLITPGSVCRLCDVGINPSRMGVIHILRAMGADISIEKERLDQAEPVADIVVRYSPLQGICIPQEHVVSAIDEFPVIFIAAACAAGVTELRNARELRVKETDRIAAMAAGLSQLGINCQVFDDGISIEGGHFSGGEVDALGDHRVAMAFAVAGAVADDTISIGDCANVSTSFPNFIQLAQQVGLQVTRHGS